jgi:DNA adenine methylase
MIRSFMGFGSDGHNGARPTGFRSTSNRSGTTPAHDWDNYPDALELIIARLSGVVIENAPALDVMRRNDTPTTLHYVDPPYVHSTRSTGQNSTKKNYRHEMNDEEHEQLLSFLKTLKGHVALSGYPSPIYEAAMKGWRRVERVAFAFGARKRIEVLWMNFDPPREQRSMFEAA